MAHTMGLLCQVDSNSGVHKGGVGQLSHVDVLVGGGLSFSFTFAQ